MASKAGTAEFEFDSLPLFDEEACAEFADLMADDFQKLSNNFLIDIDRAVNQIQQLPAERVAEMAELAHKYKSAAGYLGATRLRGLLEQIEIKSREGDFSGCQPFIELAAKVASETLAALKHYISQSR